MNYSDGQEIKLGDHVRTGDDEAGIVVCSIDADEYSEKHPKAQWGYLKQGVLVEFPLYGLIHFSEPNEDLELIARAVSDTRS